MRTVIDARRTLHESLRIDGTLVRPAVGAITALPVVLVFGLGLAVGTPRIAVSMAIGANLIAVISLIGAPRVPLRLALLDAAGMGLSVFVGSVTGPYPWLHAAVLVPWCFAAGMLVVFGQAQATVGTQAIIAFLVLGRFPQAPPESLRTAVLVIAGALVEVVALIVLRLPPSLRFQRNRLADAFQALAALAVRDPLLPASDVSATLDAVDRALSAPSLFGRTDVRELRGALDQARRIRLELSALAGLRARLSAGGNAPAQAAIDSCLRQAAAACTAIAAALRHPGRAGARDDSEAAYRDGLARLEQTLALDHPSQDLGAQDCLACLGAIGGQLRAAGNLVASPRPAVQRRAAGRPSIAMPPPPPLSRIRHDFAVITDNVHTDSPALRHAVRLAIAVPASAVVATWIGLPRGFWIPYAVAVILKPDYSTLFGRGIGRIIGTLVGATLAAVLVSGLHPGPSLTTIFVALTAWAAYSSWVASFPVGIGFVTALTLVILSTSLANPVSTAADRLIDVVLGGMIAMLAYRLWPTPARSAVGEAQAGLFSALGNYLDVVLGAVGGQPHDRSVITARSRATRIAWANAEAAVGRSIQEPPSARTDPSQGRGLLAAALRIARAAHAIRIDAEESGSRHPSPELDALRSGLGRALDAVANRVAGRPPGPVPALRPLLQAAEGAGGGLPRTLALNLDELVNATDTAVYLAEPPDAARRGGQAA